jgi:hypothetical protein
MLARTEIQASMKDIFLLKKYSSLLKRSLFISNKFARLVPAPGVETLKAVALLKSIAIKLEASQ